MANIATAKPAVRPRSNTPARVALALTTIALFIGCVPATTAAAPSPKANIAIAGGYYPADHEWPWVTALIDPTRAGINGDFGKSVCTAVLIAPQRVLTAAHCVVNAGEITPKPPGRFQALVGRRDLTKTTQGERRNVTGVVVHPKAYLPQTGVHMYHAFYDIAVLFLDRPVATTPATIGDPDDWNSWASVMGWGHWNYDHGNRQYDQYLRGANYDLLSDAQCAAHFDDANTQHFYGSIHVCANNAPGGAVDCITHGDSGGPLMVREGAAWRLIGITSFYPHRSDRCGAGGPFGFAWVAGSEMRNWPLTVPHPPVSTGGGSGGGGASLNLRLSRRQVRRYVRKMIRDNTNGRIKRLKRRCSRTSSRSVNCRLRWRIRRRGFSGKASFWHYAENNKPYWTYVFQGKRRKVGCRSCRAKRLMW
jgi:Trypsin